MRRSLPGAPLKVLNFDWHGMMKDLKENATVEGLWMLLDGICSQVGLWSINNYLQQDTKELTASPYDSTSRQFTPFCLASSGSKVAWWYELKFPSEERP